MERAVVSEVRGEVADLVSASPDAGLGTRRLDTESGRYRLIVEVLTRRTRDAVRAGASVLSPQAEQRIARVVHDELFGLGGFTPLLGDDRIENIDANGCDSVWVTYADGVRERVGPVAATDGDLIGLVATIAARAGAEERRFDRGVPRLSVQLPDGSRLFAVMAVSQRVSVSIRRHRYPTTTLAELTGLGMLDARLADFLAALVLARRNVVVAGGTNTGKTTLLRAMASVIPTGERLVTIEDAYELGLQRTHPNVVAMQAREPNIEGAGEVTQSELVRWALRMNPDRVIVGEIRGAEVIPMCNAMSQGNDGSMTTLHASDSRGVFAKLATYAVQAPERLPLEATNLLVAASVHMVVHLAWADGQRVVSSVREVVHADGPHVVSNEVFRPGPDGRAVPGAPLRTETADDLARVGFTDSHLAPAAPSSGWDDR